MPCSPVRTIKIRRVRTNEHPGIAWPMRLIINGIHYADLHPQEGCEFYTKEDQVTIKVKEGLMSKERTFLVEGDMNIECGGDFLDQQTNQTGPILGTAQWISNLYEYIFRKKRFLYIRTYEENERNADYRAENCIEEEPKQRLCGMTAAALLFVALIGHFLSLILGIYLLICQMYISYKKPKSIEAGLTGIAFIIMGLELPLFLLLGGAMVVFQFLGNSDKEV